MKKVLHVPRGSNKSYVQKIKDEQTETDKSHSFTNEYIHKGSAYVVDDYGNSKMRLDNHLILTNDNHSAYSTLRRILTNCDFEEVKDNFKVSYKCHHCNHNQYITDTDLLFSQFIRKNVYMYAHIRIYCGSCSKSCAVPLRAFLKKIITGYTQEPIEKYNLALPAIIDKLKQILQFDCMLNGKDTYLDTNVNELTELIYD